MIQINMSTHLNGVNGSTLYLISGTAATAGTATGSGFLADAAAGATSYFSAYREIIMPKVQESGTTTQRMLTYGYDWNGGTATAWVSDSARDMTPTFHTGAWVVLMQAYINTAGSIYFNGAITKRFGGLNV